ncbi:hypothetical protein MDS_1392 [Ectopseudomonas mendocina NK-01]|nr:hypothetical protein MDS_1392 [Pseudomonas mendocina NK-01]
MCHSRPWSRFRSPDAIRTSAFQLPRPFGERVGERGFDYMALSPGPSPASGRGECIN